MKNYLSYWLGPLIKKSTPEHNIQRRYEGLTRSHGAHFGLNNTTWIKQIQKQRNP